MAPAMPLLLVLVAALALVEPTRPLDRPPAGRVAHRQEPPRSERKDPHPRFVICTTLDWLGVTSCSCPSI
ncbi:hypothetical protein ABZ905_28265 [Streptomyces parvus]|uniref:hypothetical protein n=1 Tax=Streptomyces parvus TaxID=66428 RepID=UPI00340D819D